MCGVGMIGSSTLRLLLIALLSLALVYPSPNVAAVSGAAPQLTSQAKDGMVQVVVEFASQPGVQIYAGARGRSEADASGQARQHIQQIDQAQRRLLPKIAGLQGKVLYRMQRVYNGMGVLIPAGKVEALRSLPGVRAVHPAVLHRPSASENLELVGAPTAWSYAGGLTGAGQKIAIIDTGLDYTHADFGGSGTLSAFAAAQRDTTIVEPGSGFPSRKVIGGVDLVGDHYNAEGDGDAAVPRPDPDPLDCYGHGTHVAGIAAGSGVTKNQATYAGPYSTDTLSQEFEVSPGVAPEAQLYAIKIFGCAGSSAVTPAAIEWVIDPNGDGDFADRLDVINLSLGSAFGSGYDASAVAADNAAKAGIVVVASAGNQGDTYYAVSSPGTAGQAIAVAASSGESVAPFSSRGPQRGGDTLKPDIAAPGSSIMSASKGSGSSGIFLSGTSMAAPHVAGAASLLRQLHPSWSVEEIKAALLNTAGPQLHTGEGAPFSLLRGGSGRLNLERAIRTPAVAFSVDNPGEVSLSFGALEVVDTLTVTKHLHVLNKSTAGAPITYQIGVTPVLTATGATVTSTLKTVTVPAGGLATVPVVLSIPDGSALSRTRDQTLTPFAGEQLRHYLNELAGFVTLSPTNTTLPSLQVGYLATPRQAGNIEAIPGTIMLEEGSGTASLQLRGTSAAAAPLASAFELQHRSPPLQSPPNETGGVLLLGRSADLQYVGVTTDYRRTGDVGQSTVSFGLATYEPWSTPGEVTFEIDIDNDRNGSFDRTVIVADTGPASGLSGAGDVFRVRIRNTLSGVEDTAGRVNFLDGDVDSGLYNGRVMAFGVRASQLGLLSSRSTFNYRVRSYHLDAYDQAFARVLIDQTPILRYDVAEPGLDPIIGTPLVDGSPLVRVTSGMTLALRSNVSAVTDHRSQGVLLLFHNNLAARQAQAITAVVETGEHRVFLPTLAGRR